MFFPLFRRYTVEEESVRVVLETTMPGFVKREQTHSVIRPIQSRYWRTCEKQENTIAFFPPRSILYK